MIPPEIQVGFIVIIKSKTEATQKKTGLDELVVDRQPCALH